MRSEVLPRAAGPYAIWWLPPLHLTTCPFILEPFTPATQAFLWTYQLPVKFGPAQSLSLLLLCVECFFPIFTRLYFHPSDLCSFLTSPQGPLQTASCKTAALSPHHFPAPVPAKLSEQVSRFVYICSPSPHWKVSSVRAGTCRHAVHCCWVG